MARARCRVFVASKILPCARPSTPVSPRALCHLLQKKLLIKLFVPGIRVIPDYAIGTSSLDDVTAALALPSAAIADLADDDVYIMDANEIDYVTDLSRILKMFTLRTVETAYKLLCGRSDPLAPLLNFRDLYPLFPIEDAKFDLLGVVCIIVFSPPTSIVDATRLAWTEFERPIHGVTRCTQLGSRLWQPTGLYPGGRGEFWRKLG